MKWIKNRQLFLKEEKEAKIRDVIFKRQSAEVKSVWGERYLDLEEIEATDRINQGVWKLSEEDKLEVLSQFFDVEMDSVYRKFKELPEKFIDVLKKSINFANINGKYKTILSDMDLRNPNVDQISALYDNILRKLSINDTLATSIISRDDSGRPIKDENNKMVMIEKEAGDPVFSKNLVNINAFITDYNACYDDEVDGSYFSGRDLQKIRDRSTSDASEDESCNYDVDIFSKDMYLSILHKPKDILNMSVTKFYGSCQNLYTGGYRNQLLGNVFDPNSIPAFLKFDSEIKRDGKVISDQIPLCRMMIRNLEKFDDTQPVEIYFDRAYPDRMREVMCKMIENYSGNKQTVSGYNIGNYSFMPDIGEEDALDTPYMDNLGIKKYKYIGKNYKSLYISSGIDWSKTKISPKSSIKELVVDSLTLPSNISNIKFNLEWIKFKNLKINTLSDFKMKAESIAFDKCKFENSLLKEIKESFGIKRLQIISCDISNIDLSIFDELDEIQLLYTVGDSDPHIKDILGNLKFRKLLISSDIMSGKNSEYIKSISDSVEVKTIGPKL